MSTGFSMESERFTLVSIRDDVPSPPILSRRADTCAGFFWATDIRANAAAIMDNSNLFMMKVRFCSAVSYAIGNQCASSQLLPHPASAMRGTESCAAFCISSITSACNCSRSSGNTLKFSSSCT